MGRRPASACAWVLALGLLVAACGGGSDEPGVISVAASSASPVIGPGSRSNLVADLPSGQLAYTLILPDGFQATERYPILLALPPGSQGQAEVDAVLGAYWQAEAQARGWIVVSPVAPDGELFFEDSGSLLPELLDLVAATYPPEGGRFHVAGVSNGGLSAFRVALDHPERISSLLAVPGYPPTDDDRRNLDRLVDIPVFLVVGESDSGWRQEMEATEAKLRALGAQVELVVSPGDGHIVQSTQPSVFWDFLDSTR